MKIELTALIAINGEKPKGMNISIDGKTMETMKIDEIRHVIKSYFESMVGSMLKDLNKAEDTEDKEPVTIEETEVECPNIKKHDIMIGVCTYCLGTNTVKMVVKEYK